MPPYGVLLEESSPSFSFNRTGHIAFDVKFEILTPIPLNVLFSPLFLQDDKQPLCGFPKTKEL